MIEYIALYILLVSVLVIYYRNIKSTIYNQYHRLAVDSNLEKEYAELKSVYDDLVIKHQLAVDNLKQREKDYMEAQMQYNKLQYGIEEVQTNYQVMNELYHESTDIAQNCTTPSFKKKETHVQPALYPTISKKEKEGEKSESILSMEVMIMICVIIYLARFELTSLPSEGNALSIEL